MERRRRAADQGAGAPACCAICPVVKEQALPKAHRASEKHVPIIPTFFLSVGRLTSPLREGAVGEADWGSTARAGPSEVLPTVRPQRGQAQPLGARASCQWAEQTHCGRGAQRPPQDAAGTESGDDTAKRWSRAKGDSRNDGGHAVAKSRASASKPKNHSWPKQTFSHRGTEAQRLRVLWMHMPPIRNTPFG